MKGIDSEVGKSLIESLILSLYAHNIAHKSVIL